MEQEFAIKISKVELFGSFYFKGCLFAVLHYFPLLTPQLQTLKASFFRLTYPSEILNSSKFLISRQKRDINVELLDNIQNLFKFYILSVLKPL